MKRKFIGIFLITVMLAVAMLAFAACNKDNPENPGEEGNEPMAPQEYTIQYSDDSGSKQITVTLGQPYSISDIPSKVGYEFLGLYDAEIGGTQYVNKNGSSLSPFTDGKSIVLYPQFKAKEYIVVLDYQGAEITGNRQITVDYGAALPELPKNLALSNKKFVGWFTETNKGGVQIADKYGLIPVVSVLNEDNFNLNNKYIYLYAGFEGEKYTVTFYFAEGMPSEEIDIEYGTNIREIVTETRVDGKAVVAWSTDSAGTEIFNGKITEEKVLYAAEYAPVIDFDANGGSAVNSLIARAGSSIALPTPKRTNYTFIGWKTSDGTVVSYNTMPSDSATLKAVWQANIVFDSNGGTEVNAISQATGTKITLPSPERSGYIFAGWYTQNKQQYTATSMPETSISLNAGWYKIATKSEVLIPASTEICTNTSFTSSYRPNIDDSKYCYSFDTSAYKGYTVKITAGYKVKATGTTYSVTESNPEYSYTSYYNRKEASDAYKIWEYCDKQTDKESHNYQHSTTLAITNDKIFVCIYMSGRQHHYWTDFYVNIEYPDTTKLY